MLRGNFQLFLSYRTLFSETSDWKAVAMSFMPDGCRLCQKELFDKILCYAHYEKMALKRQVRAWKTWEFLSFPLRCRPAGRGDAGRCFPKNRQRLEKSRCGPNGAKPQGITSPSAPPRPNNPAAICRGWIWRLPKASA